MRAAAGRKPAHGGTASHQTKRQRDSAYHSHAHKDMDFLGSDDGMDSDTDISKLSAEEQERVIAARLAETDNEKDARRLKRCVWTDFREWVAAFGVRVVGKALGSLARGNQHTLSP